MWGFAPVPGVRKPDGTIDRLVGANAMATMMIKAAKNKEASWEFMKWWTSAETQERFGREMETLLARPPGIPPPTWRLFPACRGRSKTIGPLWTSGNG